jgi:hypothetical protein
MEVRQGAEQAAIVGNRVPPSGGERADMLSSASDDYAGGFKSAVREQLKKR